MFGYKDILLMVKQASYDIYNSQKPMEVCYGTVENISPLSIRVEQKMLLESDQLTLTRNVIDYDLNITVNHNTDSAQAHTHGYTGTKTFTINNALKQGEKVILIRVQGGQKYLVLDRVVN